MDNSLIPLWLQFVESPFHFEHNHALAHKAWSIKAWLGDFGVEKLNWPAQNTNLTPWNTWWKFPTLENLVESSQRSGSYYSCKEGTNPYILTPMDLEWDIIKSPLVQ